MGGTGFSEAHGIGLDAAGNVYVTGYSDISWGTPLIPHIGGKDAFVLKLDKNGSRIWNAFLGSASGNDRGWAVAPDVGDFGAVGLWLWNAGAWTQLSGVNADYVAAGTWAGGQFLIGDFGATGLWQWKGAWTQLSGVNADFVITADTDNDGEDEVAGDFGAVGLWLADGGAWTQLSGTDAEFMVPADINADSRAEVAVDFSTTGLWLWSPTAGWAQASGVNADSVLSGDFDNDSYDELHGRLRDARALALRPGHLVTDQRP